MSEGLRIAHIRADLLGAPMDPFLMCDVYEMQQPFFPPHPHAGFSAVTYMRPDSPGSFINRDSLGDRSVIRPGGIHWTEAARGMMHEEVPSVPGVPCMGFQIFVNLEASLKLAEPRVYHVEPEAVPVVRNGHAAIRIPAGTLGEVRSPLQPRTRCAVWDVSFAAAGSAVLPVPGDWRVFGILTAGSLEGQSAQGTCAVRFEPEGQLLELRAAAAGTNVLLLAGLPLNEPLAFGGPFVMSSEAQLQDAKRRYAKGDMGSLAPSFTR